MHSNYVLNTEILKTIINGLNWGLNASKIEFEWFNTEKIMTYHSEVSMTNQVIFYDNEKSINFPMITGSKCQDRKSFNINQINWVSINGIKYELKHNLANDIIYHINYNVINENSKNVRPLFAKVA